MQPENALTQTLNVQDSKGETPTVTGVVMTGWNCHSLLWYRTAATLLEKRGSIGKLSLTRWRTWEKEVSGKGDVQVTAGFFPKCSKGGICELKIKLPGASLGRGRRRTELKVLQPLYSPPESEV